MNAGAVSRSGSIGLPVGPAQELLHARWKSVSLSRHLDDPRIEFAKHPGIDH
jgi:hypothetical protein